MRAFRAASRSICTTRVARNCNCGVPEELAKSLMNPPEDISNTAPALERLILVPFTQNPNEWPSKIPQLIPLASKYRGTMTSVLASYSGEGVVSDKIVVYPQGASFESLEKLEANMPLDANAGTTLLICSHMQRDERCGVLGPLLAQSFKEEIARQGLDIKVRLVSHVGGHKYAGNVLVCGQGRIVWYGMVQPKWVADIVRSIAEQTTVSELLRGINKSV